MLGCVESIVIEVIKDIKPLFLIQEKMKNKKNSLFHNVPKLSEEF